MVKSWKWINAYEKAREKYGVEKSKQIANKTIIKKPIKRRGVFGGFRL